MRYITLTVNETAGGKKIEVAREEKFPIAESLDDVLAMENEDLGWDAEEIVACFNSGSRVKRQTQLRLAADMPSNVKIFKKLSLEQQDAILREKGLI